MCFINSIERNQISSIFNKCKSYREKERAISKTLAKERNIIN